MLHCSEPLTYPRQSVMLCSGMQFTVAVLVSANTAEGEEERRDVQIHLSGTEQVVLLGGSGFQIRRYPGRATDDVQARPSRPPRRLA
jgi:hypothetical protein